MSQLKMYLAGPEVFHVDSERIGETNKQHCNTFGYEGLYPLDTQVSGKTPDETAKLIVQSNMQKIQDCDYVIANLSNFRGSEEHPCCDSGTAWECGYGLALGKKIIAYCNNSTPDSIPKEIKNSIHLVTKGTFFSALEILDSVVLREIECISPKLTTMLNLSIDPPYEDIHDANPVSAFILGYRCGKNMKCKAYLTDFRTQVQKYGKTDANNNAVENFGKPVNIMISENCKIISTTAIEDDF